MSDSLWPHGLYNSWNSPGQNTGVGSLSLHQGIFPTQWSNPGLSHCGRILYQLSHKGSPTILGWVAIPFSSRSSGLRNRTGVSWIADEFFTNWATREALPEDQHFFPFKIEETLYAVRDKAMAPHSSTLAWKIPWTEEPVRLQAMGLLRVGHDWATSLSLFTFMHWRRKWQPTPVFLPGESQGREAWWAAVYGVAQSRTRLKWFSIAYMQ